MKTIKHPLGIIAFFFSVATFFSVIGCEGGGGGGDDDDYYYKKPDNVSVALDSASAAASVTLSGFDTVQCPLRTAEIYVGGELAPATLNAAGNVVMLLPLFYDESAKWSIPPSGPQDIEIYCGGTLSSTLPAAITVTELKPAPGTTRAMINDYIDLAYIYQEVVSVLAPQDGLQQVFFNSFFIAVQNVLGGIDENSLTVILDGLEKSDPEILGLLDAAHAASGVHRSIAEFKSLLQDMRAESGSFPLLPDVASTVASTTGEAELFATDAQGVSAASQLGRSGVFDTPITALDDQGLAKAMQAQAILSLFTNQVISETATQFGRFAGLFGIVFHELPQVKVADLVLFALDNLMKKFVLSTLPSQITAIDLNIPKVVLENSERTVSEFTIYAKNKVEGVSFTDYVELTLIGLGLSGPSDDAVRWLNTFEDGALNAIQLVLKEFNNVFRSLAAAYPGTFEFDFDVSTTVPEMTFKVEGETPELYRLYPLQNQSPLVRSLDEELEWLASDEHWGTKAVWLEPRPSLGESGLWGGLWRGGAFGENPVPSNQITLVIGDITFVIEKRSVYVPEDESITVAVKLSNAPLPEQQIVANIERDSGDTDISVSSGWQLYFDESNWDEFQDFGLSAAEDDDAEDGMASILLWADIYTDEYGTIRLEDTVTATESDNDKLYFLVYPATVFIEEESTATFAIRLNDEPSSPVRATISHDSGDPDISLQSASALLFNEENWDVGQTVTLYAEADDDSENGSAIFKIEDNSPESEIGIAYVTATEAYADSVSNTLKISGSRAMASIGDSLVHAHWHGEIPVSIEIAAEKNLTSIEGGGTLSFNYSYNWKSGSGESATFCQYREDGNLVADVVAGSRKVYPGVAPRLLITVQYNYDTVAVTSCNDGYYYREVKIDKLFNTRQFGLEEKNGYVDEYRDDRVYYRGELLDKHNL